jgi:hypothetical protein
MTANRRKKPRKSVNRLRVVARDSDGALIASCSLHDVSERGARLGVNAGEPLPDEFILQLTRNGKVLRHCRVVWRRGEEVGVKYIAVDPTLRSAHQHKDQKLNRVPKTSTE